MTDSPAPARPSASVVVVRDGPDALEVLMLRRNDKIAFHGGAWVFPGGRVDAVDLPADGGSDLDAARRAAVREALEETGLELDPGAMLPFAHWTTPVELPKRFATWFFGARVAPAVPIRIDQSEIVDYRWLTPAAVLERHAAGEMDLPAPTYVTLLEFGTAADSATLAARLGARAPQRFVPRLVPVAEGRCTLYAEDAGYESLDFDAPGPRHRLLMRKTGWQYLRDF